jgi:phage terminase Nu1 subunit (DNA packaging protein)
MVAVEPRPLPSLNEIAKAFKRSKATIKRWYEDGAPIWKDGESYGGDYHDINAWLLSRSKRD